MKLTANQRNRIARLLIVFMVTLSVGTGLSVVLAAPAQQATGGWATYTLQSGASTVAADTVGTGRVAADYGWAECYQIVNVHDTQRVTTTLQHSPDNTNWVNGEVFPGRAADGVDYLTTAISGTYIRSNLDVMNAVTVNVTLTCIAKDRSN